MDPATKFGTPSKFSQVDVATWYGRVYAQCQSKLISKADAEDATQETFLRAFKQVSKLRSQEALGGWLRRIAHNVCVDMIRKNRVRATTGDVNAVVASVDETTEPPPLLDALRELDEPYREVILLHYYEKMTYDQMAAWLGVARSTVNDRLSRARQQLRKMLAVDRSSHGFQR